MTPGELPTPHYLVLAGALLAGLFAWWLKAEHIPSEPVEVAKAFIVHLKMEQMTQAYELTTKHSAVGSSIAEFEAFSRREPCRADRFVGTSPFQSNGNRLRRRLSGGAVEMPEVRVEFEGPCLLGITVRHSPDDTWRVARFASHAG